MFLSLGPDGVLKLRSFNLRPVFFLVASCYTVAAGYINQIKGTTDLWPKTHRRVLSCLVDDFMDPDFVSVWFYLQPETKFFFSLQIAIYRVFNGQWVINKLSCLRSGPPANKSERPSVNKRATDQLGLGGWWNFKTLPHPLSGADHWPPHHSLGNDDCFDEQTHLAIHKSLGADTASISFRLSTE